MTKLLFNFTFITDDHDRFEVLTHLLNYGEIEQECDRVIAAGPDAITCFNEAPCLDSDHATYCPLHDAYDTPWEHCIEDKLAEAQRRITCLPLLHVLRECALNPAAADRANIQTLNGMALAEGPILQNKYISEATVRIVSPVTDAFAEPSIVSSRK